MKNLIKCIFTLSFAFFLYACTETPQNETPKVATEEKISKTATEQSPAYIRADRPKTMSKMQMQMDGTWQDANNDKHMFVIAGDEYYKLYEGRQVAKMKFDIYSACPAEKGELDENGDFIWLRTAIDTTCYKIAYMDNTIMTLVDMEEGKQSRFERK